MIGDIAGELVRDNEGADVGSVRDAVVGVCDVVGVDVGMVVGLSEDFDEEEAVGFSVVGVAVGAAVGLSDGFGVGELVGWVECDGSELG